MASANILLVIINHLLYRFIARQASVVLVKVMILSCVSWPVCLSYKRHDGRSEAKHRNAASIIIAVFP